MEIFGGRSIWWSRKPQCENLTEICTIIHSMSKNATEQENPLFSMMCCIILYLRILATSEFAHWNYIHASGRLLAMRVFYFLHLPSPHCRLLAQDTDPECLGFAIRFPAHSEWSPMISDMKGVFSTCPWVQWAPNLATDISCRSEWTSDPTFKFQMFSNDILTDIIVIKAVTEKTVRNLNLNFKFLSNGNFRWWAFRNYAYFVMKPSG